MQDDRRLKADVLAQLAFDPSIQAEKIGVAVRDGIVTLSGTVNGFWQKDAAEQAAGRVRGVRAITEEIAVRLPDDCRRDDADIAAAVLDRLAWDPALPPGAVGVTVSSGVVTLSGQLDHAWQRAIAESHVRHLRGVTGLASQVELAAPAPPAHLLRDIRVALNRTVLRDENIDVHVAGGAVHLTGSVASWHDRALAAQTALAAPGATSVMNDIRVG